MEPNPGIRKLGTQLSHGVDEEGGGPGGGEVRRVLGTVSVNHHIVDVDGLDVDVGGVVELVSRDGENSIERVAETVGIMVCSFCVALNPLILRVYCEGAVPPRA